MLPASANDIVHFPLPLSPKVICIIDAEEEFDWNAPFAASNNSVTTIAAQSKAQAIFRRFNLVPTYAVDYPVASQERGYRPLREFAEAGHCEIGAQLHPWVTPPYDEILGEENSFACNLPRELQFKKIEALTAMIRKNFNVAPKLFRTGRYGAGAETPRLLEDFGYEIDCSVLPGPRITKSSPDYSGAPSQPYWLSPGRRVLEIPVTAGLIGPMRYFQNTANRSFTSSFSRRAKLPAILSRVGILNRVRISPEGYNLADAKNLTRTLLRTGQRVFAISYHSPSLEPSKTPYTRSSSDVEKFLNWIEHYLEFFIGELGGTPSTPGEILTLARSAGIPQSQAAIPPRQETARLGTLRPSVCVVIPAYNSEATIRRALDSVAAQTLPADRILVVDDASADSTADMAGSYPGVEVVRLTANLGAAGARNVGIRNADTDLIAFLDADDEWLPTKLEKQMALIISDPDSTFVSCGSDLISPAGRNLGDIYRGQTVTAGSAAWKALLRDNYVTTPSILVWRRHLEELGGFNQSLKIAEDQDMWIRLAERGSLGYVFESLVHVHERHYSLSGGSFNDQLMYTLPMIEGHIARLSHQLTRREIRSILGRRTLRLGQLAYSRGASDIGRKLISRSIGMGYGLSESILFLANANPAAVWLKKNVLRR